MRGQSGAWRLCLQPLLCHPLCPCSSGSCYFLVPYLVTVTTCCPLHYPGSSDHLQTLIHLGEGVLTPRRPLPLCGQLAERDRHCYAGQAPSHRTAWTDVCLRETCTSSPHPLPSQGSCGLTGRTKPSLGMPTAPMMHWIQYSSSWSDATSQVTDSPGLCRAMSLMCQYHAKLGTWPLPHLRVAWDEVKCLP